MANPRLVLAAALGNVLVIAACFAIYGRNAEGAGVATRCTARVAVCFFLAGFAAPGVRKWLPRCPEAASLIQAFVAAQMIHFCAVIALHTKFAVEPLRFSWPPTAVVLIGFSIVLGTGITARPRGEARIYRGGHLALLYIVWLIVALDYAKHPLKPFRLVAILAVIALVLRHLPRRDSTKRNAVNLATGDILSG